MIRNAESVRHEANPFRVYKCLTRLPRVVAALQPWAEISERLRRCVISKLYHVLANAFGVVRISKLYHVLANAFVLVALISKLYHYGQP